MFWSKLINRAETVHGTLCFLYLSLLFYGICVKIFIMNRYISKELHNQQEYYRPTIYRTGAAVVWTITSYFNNRSEVSNRGLDIEKKNRMLLKHHSVLSKHKFRKLSLFMTGAGIWNREKMKCHSRLFYRRAAIRSIPRWGTSNVSRNSVPSVCFYSNRRFKYNIKALVISNFTLYLLRWKIPSLPSNRNATAIVGDV